MLLIELDEHTLRNPDLGQSEIMLLMEFDEPTLRRDCLGIPRAGSASSGTMVPMVDTEQLDVTLESALGAAASRNLWWS